MGKKSAKKIHNPYFDNHGHEKHKKNASDRATKYYTKESKEIIKQIYSDDFEMLGYDKDKI